MRKQWIALLGVVAALGLAAPARAAAVHAYIANLTGAQETPPNDSDSLGMAFMFLDPQGRLCYAISFTRLSTAEVAAHIHGPAAPGASANVLFALTPAGNPKNGCAGPLSATDKKNLKKGLLYLNIHSAKFPNGEIRGQVVPAGVIKQ